jgi:hypothetical protein
VKYTQYDEGAVRQLVANLVLRGERPPDLSGAEALSVVTGDRVFVSSGAEDGCVFSVEIDGAGPRMTSMRLDP